MTFASELTAWLETRLATLHTVTVARVVTFDASGPWASVQPLLRRTYVVEDGTETVVTLPQVERCPVVYPRGGGWSQTWPLQVDDLVLIVMAERSLDRWLASSDGAVVSPGDPRKHDLSDAIVLAGIAPWAKAAPVDPADLVITREGTEAGRAAVRLKSDGSVILGDGASLGVARETDMITVDPSTAPGLYAALAAIAGALTVPQPPFTGAISGRISSASGKVKAT